MTYISFLGVIYLLFWCAKSSQKSRTGKHSKIVQKALGDENMEFCLGLAHFMVDICIRFGVVPHL